MMMNLENKKLNIIGMTMIHMMSYWIDMKVTMEIISQCQNPKMHPLIKMSHVLGGEMFVDRTKLVEFRVGQLLKKFQSFALALKDYCIQQGFRDRRTKFERRKVVYNFFVDKCTFKLYSTL